VGGCFVPSVGWDEAVIREYIQRQADEDKRLEQMTYGMALINHRYGGLRGLELC